jgi:polyisoprenoid-binding protein YceI
LACGASGCGKIIILITHNMRKILSIIAIVVIVAVAAYAYVTRPVSAPTTDINDVSSKLLGGSATSSVYRISQEKSVVRFTLNEMLNGKPKLVVGTTTQIAGDIALRNGEIEMGTLTLNAKTLVTDSANRNGAIVRLILKSDKPENEFITFEPTSNDFSGTLEEGKTISFNVKGDLTISGVTKPATFKVTLTPTRERLMGTAETKLSRSDFGLVIPNLSFVANVDNEFPVIANIVAERIMQ